MEHLDDDLLALVAMADQSLTATQEQHLSTCADCRRRFAEFGETIELARSARTVELSEPSPLVWDRIHAELELAEDVGPQSEAVVTPITARRTRWWIPAVAAAIGLIAGAVGAVWWSSTGSATDPVVQAEATLDPFPGWSGTGNAAVVIDADGRREVVVDLEGVDVGTELVEVWLIRADASGLVSIGLMDGTSGRFVIPAGVDIAEYPLVDVSAEPDDGDPNHSGDSIVRGELRST